MTLIKTLIRHEGSKVNSKGMHIPYKDSVGIITIGYGINIDQGLYEDEARWLLESRIKRTEAELRSTFKWFRHLSQARKEVLINMCFNLGIGRLKGFKKTLKAIEDGDYETASKQMLDSKWAKQVGSRANELSEIMLMG